MKNRLSLLFLLFIGNLFAQQPTAVKMDTNYKRPYYDQRVSLFKVLPKVKNATVFIGNSITDGGEWAELLNCKKCLNRGISGDISFGVNARLDDVLADKPKKLILLIGINDLSRNVPSEMIIDNYKSFVKRTKAVSPKTKIYLQSVLPVNSSIRKFTDKLEENIPVLNDAMRQIAKDTEGVFFIDLYAKFLDKEGRLDKKYTNDGLHLLGEGYLLWVKILKESGYLK